jgi:hypothetical protein
MEVEAEVILGTAKVASVVLEVTGEGAFRSTLSPIPYLGVGTKSEGTTTPIIGLARGGIGDANTLLMRQAIRRH